MAKTQQQYIDEATQRLAAQKQTDLNTSNSLYDLQKEQNRTNYQGQIDDTVASYTDALKSNQTQLALNQRALERRMAEMGLTDSGLNRTQQTALTLGASNNESKIMLQRQRNVDTLARAMASNEATIEANKTVAAAQIEKDYSQQAYSEGTSNYNAEQEAIAKAQEEAAKKTLWDATGVTDEYGNLIFENKDGNKKTVAKGYSPYGYNSNTMYAQEKAAGIKFSSNGYQPLGLVSEGGNFEVVSTNGTPIEYYGTGKKQNLWVSPMGNYFYWDGTLNRYVKLTDEEVAQLQSVYGKFDTPISKTAIAQSEGAKRRESNKASNSSTTAKSSATTTSNTVREDFAKSGSFK